MSTNTPFHSYITNYPPLAFLSYLSFETRLLHRPKREVAKRRERERELEADVPAERGAAELADRARVPRLGHTEDGAHDADAEGADGGETGGQAGGLAVGLGGVAREGVAAEDEVLGEGDALVDGEPVADDQHEVLQRGLEVVVARDRYGEVHAGADEGPHEPGYAARLLGQELKG